LNQPNNNFFIFQLFVSLMKIFDLIVVGSGSGLDVAVAAVNRGLKVAIVEKGPLGGTCLNRGCIPSKMIIHTAEVADIIRSSKLFGIKSKINQINFPAVTGRANKLVDADSREIETGVRATQNQTLFRGKAVFVTKNTLEVNGERIQGRKIVIAAGARPLIPPIKGLEKVPYLTSAEALRQTKLPKSMIIIGGGYIGVELGYFYASMGCKITIIQRASNLIPREDEEIASLFTQLWKKRYHLITNAEVRKVEKIGAKIKVYFQQGSSSKNVSAEKILIAAGIKPNSDLLKVEKIGIKTTKYGFIEHNKFMETGVKNIWVLGDITGVYLFKHAANLQAEVVAHNVLKSKKIKVDYYPMPHAIFTSPQVAGVGLTEQEARQARKNYAVGKYYYKNTGMGAAMEEKDGFAKFIVDKKTKEILGFHIIGPEASIALHEVVVAMKANKRKALSILQNTIHIHPALNEVVHRAALNVGAENGT